MRHWLKGDAALDVVSFFILRKHEADAKAPDDELSLIRFPVEELFTDHLSSFDAVVLQDFDAVDYDLNKYIPNLRKYVIDGGGLVMVGGAHGFSAGKYAGTKLEDVLPVELPSIEARNIDTTPFAPSYTSVGRNSPVLEALVALHGDRVPEMSGANVFGVAKTGAVVLWEHPTLRTNAGPMPVLVLGESGNGRVIALGIDGTHRLAFGEMAAMVAGRGYGALWDALLGWLMREARYESARVELQTQGSSQCRAGVPTPLRVHTAPGLKGEPHIQLALMGSDSASTVDPTVVALRGHAGIPFTGVLPPLDPGGYALKLRVGDGPASRFEFACERGGTEWADSRPDLDRLRAISDATQGKFVRAVDVGQLNFPAAVPVASERRVSPVFPPWVWSLCAAVATGIHWLARRWAGLA